VPACLVWSRAVSGAVAPDVSYLLLNIPFICSNAINAASSNDASTAPRPSWHRPCILLFMSCTTECGPTITDLDYYAGTLTTPARGTCERSLRLRPKGRRSPLFPHPPVQPGNRLCHQLVLHPRHRRGNCGSSPGCAQLARSFRAEPLRIFL